MKTTLRSFLVSSLASVFILALAFPANAELGSDGTSFTCASQDMLKIRFTVPKDSSATKIVINISTLPAGALVPPGATFKVKHPLCAEADAVMITPTTRPAGPEPALLPDDVVSRWAASIEIASSQGFSATLELKNSTSNDPINPAGAASQDWVLIIALAERSSAIVGGIASFAWDGTSEGRITDGEATVASDPANPKPSVALSINPINQDIDDFDLFSITATAGSATDVSSSGGDVAGFTPSAYRWSLDEAWTTSNVASNTWQDRSAGSHGISLSVSDGEGAWSIPVTQQISIAPPVASFELDRTRGAISADAARSFTVAITNTSDSAYGAVWTVTKDDGGDSPTVDTTANTCTFTESGTYRIWLTVTDEATQYKAKTSHTVTVDPANPKPVVKKLKARIAQSGSDSGPGFAGYSITATACWSDLDSAGGAGTIVAYEWTMDGTTISVAAPANPSACADDTTAYSTSRTWSSLRKEGHPVTFRVRDSEGAWSDPSTIIVQINTPTVRFEVDRTIGYAPLPVRFIDQSSPPAAVARRWTVRKGYEENGAFVAQQASVPAISGLTPSCTFERGVFQITLTISSLVQGNEVVEDATLSASDTKYVRVSRKGSDIALIMDHSGSMQADGWAVAANAAAAFADLLGMLNTALPALAADEKDRLRLFSYTSSRGGFTWRTGGVFDWRFAREHADGIKEWPSFDPLPFSAAPDFYTPFPGQAFAWTPTGEALIRGIDRLEALAQASPADRKRCAIIVTDGENNAGYNAIIPDVSNRIQQSRQPSIKNMKVDAIVVGSVPNSRAGDLSTLSASDTGGVYRRVGDERDLPSFFAQALGDFGENISALKSVRDQPPGTFDVSGLDPGEGVAFMAVWNHAGGGPFGIRAKRTVANGQPAEVSAAIPAALPPNAALSSARSTDRYAILRLEGVTKADIERHGAVSPTGRWRIELVRLPSSPPLFPASVKFYAFVETKVRVWFDLGRGAASLGQPIPIRLDLRELGAPVAGAVVSVEVERPALSLGALLSKNPAPPLKATPPIDQGGFADHLAAALKAEGHTSFPTKRAVIALLDDGTGSDEKAGDGIYSGQFADTRYEGDYTFVLSAKGRSPTGLDFESTATGSRFVAVVPDPGRSRALYIPAAPGGPAGGTVLLDLRDRYGDPLGPYLDDSVGIDLPGIDLKSAQRGYDFDKRINAAGGYYVRIPAGVSLPPAALDGMRARFRGGDLGLRLPGR